MPIKFSVFEIEDRDVDVTVTLTFKESALRVERDAYNLSAYLAEKFRDAIDLGADGNDAYVAFESTL